MRQWHSLTPVFVGVAEGVLESSRTISRPDAECPVHRSRSRSVKTRVLEIIGRRTQGTQKDRQRADGVFQTASLLLDVQLSLECNLR